MCDANQSRILSKYKEPQPSHVLSHAQSQVHAPLWPSSPQYFTVTSSRSAAFDDEREALRGLSQMPNCLVS